MSEGTTKSTKIAVTVPRGGFRPIPGNTFGKYHPFFTSEYGCVKSDFSQCLLSDAVKQQGEVIDTPLGVDALSTGMGAQMAGPMGDSSMVMDKNPQELKPALQVQTGSESVTYSSQANVASPRNNGQCSRFFGSASEELHTVSPFCVADYANSPSSGPSVMASPIIPESNTHTVVSAKAGVTTPSKQQVVLALGSRRCSRRQLSRHLPTVSQVRNVMIFQGLDQFSSMVNAEVLALTILFLRMVILQQMS